MPAKIQLTSSSGVKVNVEVNDMGISESTKNYDYVTGVFRHTHSKVASIFLRYKAYNKQGVVVDTGYLASATSMPSKEWYSFECALAKNKGIVRLDFDVAASNVYPD